MSEFREMYEGFLLLRWSMLPVQNLRVNYVGK